MQEERSAGQLIRISAVYDMMARALPTEGRDYSIDFVFDKEDPSRVSVKFESFTEIGRIWCDYCSKILKSGNLK